MTSAASVVSIKVAKCHTPCKRDDWRVERCRTCGAPIEVLRRIDAQGQRDVALRFHRCTTGRRP